MQSEQLERKLKRRNIWYLKDNPFFLADEYGWVKGVLLGTYILLSIVLLFSGWGSVVGILMLLSLLGWWKYQDMQQERKIQEEITRLVLFGKRIKVDLSACHIEVVEVEKPTSYYWRGAYRCREVKKVKYCFLSYTMLLNDKSFYFESGLIDKTEDTVDMWLKLRKETTLYIDPENEKNYYLDIEFMNQE